MSAFSNPWQALPSVDEWNRMSAEFATPLQKDIAAAVNLLAHPTAPLAAMSAFGFGLAAHAFGIWAGAVVGLAQASQRFLAPFDDGNAASEAKRPAGEVVAMPGRPKPALKVVPKAEPVEAERARATPVEPAPAAPPERAVQPVPEAKPVAEPVERDVAKQVEAAKPGKAKAAKPGKAPVAEPAVAVASPAKVAPEGPRKPGAIERPEVPDDLKAISGIGPKLEKVLNDLGVWTYAQIAAWSNEEIAWVDDYLSFKGRIARDGWIEQARSLKKKNR